AYVEADAVEIGNQRYAADYRQWEKLADLAAPSTPAVAPSQSNPIGTPATPAGRFRAMPWDEYRGPNPFLFVTQAISGTAVEREGLFRSFVSGSIPVLIEPLVKLLVPVSTIVSPGVSPQTRVYLFMILVWNLAVWAFFGG